MATTLVHILITAAAIAGFILLLRYVQQLTYRRALADSNMNTAARIQKLLTPTNPTNDKSSVDIYGVLHPGKVPGGDFYDYKERDGHLYFCIGDVPGKGIQAAVYMAMVKGLFRQAILRHTDAGEILTLLNEVLAADNKQQMYCALFVGVLDLNSGELNYCNAGHGAPLLMERTLPRKVEPLSDHGTRQIPVGVVADYSYQSCRQDMTTNDCLLLYTDGITDAENKKHTPFGMEHLLKTICHTSVTHTEDICKAILRSVAEHLHGARLTDDITMLAIAPTAVFTKKEVRELHMVNSLDEIAKMTEWIEGLAEPYALAAGQVFNLTLAIEEIVVNIINYAYPGETGKPITLTASPSQEGLQIQIVDEGLPFDPTAQGEPDITLDLEQREIGGLGILLTSRLTRDIQYRREDNKNILTLLA